MWILDNGIWLDKGEWVDEDYWQDWPKLEEIPIKDNIQLFRNKDEFSNSMYVVVSEVNNIQQQQYWSLKDTFKTSRHFGEFLWDNKLFDLAAFFSRRYWSENYEAIIKAMSIAGTYEAFIIVAESAMGPGSISFENPSPSHLIVKLTPLTYNHAWMAVNADQSQEQMVAVDGDGTNDFYFADSLTPMSFQETAALIELLNVNGVFIEIQTA